MIEYALAGLLIAGLFLTGPRLILFRALLRAVLPASQAKTLAPRMALASGAAALVVTTALGALFGPAAAYHFALILVALSLAAMDFAWRWLPMPWMLILGCVGLLHATSFGDPFEATLAALLGAALLYVPRMTLKILRGYEGMGLGDVILAAAIGLNTGKTSIIWIITFAAISAMVSHYILRAVQAPTARQRLGIAFGAHLALIFAIESMV